MARRKGDSPQKAAMREMMHDYLKNDVLSMYVGENESARFWLSIMNGLKNRGVEDILIACVDGLTGFPSAIEAVYPETEIPQCIIHQIRSTTRFVSYKIDGRSEACVCSTDRRDCTERTGILS